MNRRRQQYLASALRFEHWGGSCHLSAQHSHRGRSRPASRRRTEDRWHERGETDIIMHMFEVPVGAFSPWPTAVGEGADILGVEEARGYKLPQAQNNWLLFILWKASWLLLCHDHKLLHVFYLKAMFPSPPACVFFRRHVYHWHNVSHLGSQTVSINPLMMEWFQTNSTSDTTIPQRSTRLWPGLCNVWWREQQRWQGHWLRLPQTPEDDSPCCRSKNRCNIKAQQ